MKRLLRCAAIALLLTGLAGAGTPAAYAQSAASDDTPPQVRAFLNLLADPGVRAWLEKQMAGKPPPAEPKPQEQSVSGFAAERLGMIRHHLGMLLTTAPALPGELREAATILLLEFQERGLVDMLLLIAAFVALGFGAEWLFYLAATRLEKWIDTLSLETVSDRVRAVAVRLAYGTGMVLAFAIGSVGAFLAFNWPPLVRDILLGYLLAFLAFRFSMVASRFLLAPGGERFRIVPMSTASAWFWHYRIAVVVGWFGAGWVTVQILGILGLSMPARALIAYVLGLGLLAIALEAVWRNPDARVAGRRLNATARNILLSAYLVAVWLLWVASSHYILWIAIVAGGLPGLLKFTQRAVNHILRPPEAADAGSNVPSVFAVCLERGLRAALIIGAAFLLVRVWHIDLSELATRDTMVVRLLHGGISAVVIVLAGNFAWHVLKAVIDRKLIEATGSHQPDSEDARHRARLRTLLPILRNLLFIVLVAMSALMALSSVGVEIGPLIAGAGVVGVAVGFGAQTLVRDIISGMFFLLDDAFRVGEYIQSGNYKGTVESFSLRSIKLRHHRGPLYTVPFGTLGAVQNMSRDWVIDKMTVGVTYDSDLDKARKLIKQVGKELLEDKELAANIIETLKMQGVEQFGDYAIQLRMKMMTKPGEQFVIRRRAYALIKKAFDANGIKFAFPTVQVAGGAEGAATSAVARQALELVKPAGDAAS